MRKTRPTFELPNVSKDAKEHAQKRAADLAQPVVNLLSRVVERGTASVLEVVIAYVEENTELKKRIAELEERVRLLENSGPGAPGLPP